MFLSNTPNINPMLTFSIKSAKKGIKTPIIVNDTIYKLM